MNTKRMITAEEARALLDYDPITGIFKWKVGRGGVKRGTEAGWIAEDGYRYIRIDDRLIGAHRLAWLIVHRRWPVNGIDHKNGSPGDDWIENLREATQSQNAQNARIRSDNKSGFKGVSWDSINGKWVARIRVPAGRYLNLGRFSDASEAHSVYMIEAKKLFGEFARAA